MEIRDNKNVCIIAPLSSNLDKYKTEKILEKLRKESRKIGIDLKYVNECSIDFIEEVKKISARKNIGIFNIPSDIFVLFNIMNIDKSLNFFVSELDFEENTRQIINRNFSII